MSAATIVKDNYINCGEAVFDMNNARFSSAEAARKSSAKFALTAAVCTCLCLALSSCVGSAISDEIELFSSEFDEIKEFFNPPMSTDDPTELQSADKSQKSFPILIQDRHAELIPSVYNRLTDVSAVASVGSTGELSVYAKDRTASEGEKYGYTVVSFGDTEKSENRTLDAISGILEDAGILYNIEYGKNSAPSGEVFAMEYAGFSCSDGYCINQSITVTLHVSDQKKAVTAAEGDNLVYITFDDGPSEKNTYRLLETLDTYGVKAAFFTMGSAVEKYPEAARAIVERGHVLGCHTVSHDYAKIYSSVSALEEEVDEWEGIVNAAGITKDEIGQLTFRFPGGSVSSYFDDNEADEMKAMLEGKGYYIYDWNVVTNDSVLYLAPDGTRSYDYLRDTFLETFQLCLNENSGKSGAPIIILMHETVDETADLLPWVLEYLISEGYTFGNLADINGSWSFSERG